MRAHREAHLIQRVGWLRASVLGANDGIVSTASLIVGVAAASSGKAEVLVAGFAGLVAGAMSMAAGEYVSVSSQADTERADLAREKQELASFPDSELDELTNIYMSRGLSPALAQQVAREMTAKDALAAHSGDELGIFDLTSPRPLRAAWASAAAFSVGAALPLMTAVMCPRPYLPAAVTTGSIAFLALLGAVGASAGGAPVWRAVVRVTFWGAAAMALTAGVGALFDVTV